VIHKIYELFDRCGCSISGGYPFVTQGILYLQSLLYVFQIALTRWIMWRIIQYKFHCIISRFSANTIGSKLCSHMRQNCMWHWRDFWPEIMTLVWSLNVVDSDGRPFIYITKCKGTKIVPWITPVMLAQRHWIADWYHICPQSVF
jgi:hypothetical protein